MWLTKARRVRGAFVLPDGRVLPVGGKTGTGDHRFETYGAGGRLIRSRVVNRAATFVFFIGDRFFGTITAYVPGEAAEKYHFTSGLSVQLLKILTPALTPMIAESMASSPPPLAPVPIPEEPVPVETPKAKETVAD